MTAPEPNQVTVLLERARLRDSGAVDTLFRLVYGKLRDMADLALRTDRPGHTLQPTALVHEVWLKLSDGLESLDGRAHFLAVAARAMRQVLKDHARARFTQKRGDGRPRLEITDSLHPAAASGIDLVELEDLLGQLSALNERHGQVVELRILGGLSLPEVADVLGVSLRTVEMDWQLARAWLRRALAAD